MDKEMRQVRMKYNPDTREALYQTRKDSKAEWQNIAPENNLNQKKCRQGIILKNDAATIIETMIGEFGEQFILVFYGPDADYNFLTTAIQQNRAVQRNDVKINLVLEKPISATVTENNQEGKNIGGEPPTDNEQTEWEKSNEAWRRASLELNITLNFSTIHLESILSKNSIPHRNQPYRFFQSKDIEKILKESLFIDTKVEEANRKQNLIGGYDTELLNGSDAIYFLYNGILLRRNSSTLLIQYEEVYGVDIDLKGLKLHLENGSCIPIPVNSCFNIAHMYNSLTQGDQSFIEQAAINTWGLPKGTEDTANYIYRNILGLQHPIFCLKNNGNDYYPNLVDATTIVSGSELAHAMNFPRKSVSGLPVYECVPFGREVVLHTADKPEGRDTIPLGNIYHMRTEEKNTPVSLQKDSLTAHTFITGSTGAGKSNAVYTMLNGLCPASNGDESKSHAHFLVIEPAKGEYKDVFGGRGDVYVYGTNPKKTPLLRLNPFSFPEDTHILEHIDRLVEVFNACWPMYAAMPAVLKASIETAYTDCGWDLQRSEYVGKQRSFPTFRDVMKALPKVVDTKGFSNDTQGDYKGALLTRLESLTNGINGQVLCAADEIAGQELFDKNVIVDLSRVGSSETKALLMGILVLKLQEYRMAERAENGAADNNKGLHHVTVLEEAHNLLRRTSSEQSQEGSNLQGKSVEMLTNAIAEMRTYGEGFIIADQAPGLLDMAVIRNTNTKIILRLPDESDRVLVGKAAGLNDDQIVELSRLDTGVAAVYQNHWLEPVLCKVTEFKKEQQKPFVYKPTDADTIQNSTSYMNVFFGRIVKTDPTIGELNAEDVDRLKNWIDNLPVGRNTKLQLLSVLNPEGKLNNLNKGEILYRLANGNDFLRYAGTKTDREAACTAIDQKIMQQLNISRELAEQVRREIFLYAASQIDRERLAAQYAELQQYAELPQRGVR